MPFTWSIPLMRVGARPTHEAPRRDEASIVRRELACADGIVDCIRADYVSHRFAPHWHDELVLAVVVRGTMGTRIGHRTVLAPAGSMVVVAPGEVHTGEGRSADGFSYRAMHVSPRALSSFVPDGCTPEFASPVVQEPTLVDAFVRAHAHLSTNGREPLRDEHLLLDVLERIFARHAKESSGRHGVREPRLIRQVREFLEDNHARVVTLAELATLTGRSAFHVSRVFRDQVGIPPYAYLAQVRVHRALALLARGHSATMVAHETGFVDQSHFSRQFKRTMGMAPGQYARECGLSQLSGPGRDAREPERASA